EPWNFGPSASSEVSVATIADHLVRLWGADARWERDDGGQHSHEALYLKLDCSKASAALKWRPLLQLEDALRLTVEWYQAFQNGSTIRSVTLGQIEQFLTAQVRRAAPYGKS